MVFSQILDFLVPLPDSTVDFFSTAERWEVFGHPGYGSVSQKYGSGSGFIKFLVACMMTLFLFILILNITYIHTVHSSVVIRRGSSPSPHRWSAQWEKPPWGAEPSIDHGPALQQADALPTELRRTLN
jgi:hypothetical protein